MKFLIILITLVVTGCSSTPPKAPEPKGDLKDVNPVNVDLKSVYLKAELNYQGAVNE